MKVVGLIVEYNPFHNGHRYHIEQAKKLSGADYTVAVMSGNFVQRGAPALIDKYTRTQIALKEGVDLVLELPVSYATASAELFALGAISLLDKLGCVDEVCFGSECGDINILKEIAEKMLYETEEFKLRLNEYLKNGYNFAIARVNAFIDVYKDDSVNYQSLLVSPNNILGIEYIKALLSLNSKIKPATIKRHMSGYHDLSIHNNISSATAIRHSIQSTKGMEMTKNTVPAYAYELLTKAYEKTFPITEDDFSLLLKYKLMWESPSTLTQYMDLNNGLEMRIDNLKKESNTFYELASNIKTKQLTRTRINRALMHVLLNIKTEHMQTFNNSGYCQYARILGFRKSASPLLRSIQDNPSIPVITKLADAKRNLTSIANTMLTQDIKASQLYNDVVYDKYGTELKDEFQKGVVIWEE